MIRLIFAVLFVTIYLILSIPVWGINWLIGLKNKDLMDRINYKNVQWAFKWVYRISGIKPVVRGLENVPKDQAFLFVGNHQSIFDVVLCYHFAPGITGFMAKDVLKKVPLLSTWMKLTYCLFLTRTDPREDMKIILKAIEYVKAGKSMFIFPEGTRAKTGEMAAFHEGSFKVATKGGVPVVPVAITGTREIFEAHTPFIKRGTVVITYGEPVDIATLEGDDRKYPGVYFQNLISEMLVENEKIYEEKKSRK